MCLSDKEDVKMEVLLGREPMRLETKGSADFLRGKVVLVTGGGGSIGSELCRQIARHDPKQLIILDIYENHAYDLQQELIFRYPEMNLQLEIASIRDKEKICSVFDAYRPEIVFHAAAHKHVPLMERCPEEAVKNNIFGTYHVVCAAETYGTKKFVMISTDKAVNPTSMMGATKRFCEMLLQSRCGSRTEFCAVRFGNVLGTNGSVVPLFQRQIRDGGPITLTDKRVSRYFMTIPEAVHLVLEAGAMANQGEIYVLDMGEPVKILSLAENLVRLCGLKPHEEIQMKEVGLRPGEKLCEELMTAQETLRKTANEKIFVAQQERIDGELIMDGLNRLEKAISNNSGREGLVALMRQIVTTYCAAEEVNADAQRKR